MATHGQAHDREAICTILVSAYHDTPSLIIQKSSVFSNRLMSLLRFPIVLCLCCFHCVVSRS